MATLCAGTPKITVRDNRGLEVRALRYNRSVDGAVARQYVDAQTHNALGQPVSSQDPRFFGGSTLNFQYTPALSGQVLKTIGVDAGTAKACADIAGRQIWSLTQGCDAYTHSNDNITVRMAYDALGRPARRDCITSDVSRGGSAGGAADIWCYGDQGGAPGATYDTTDGGDPRNANQRRQVIQHFDPAGLLDMSVLGYGLEYGFEHVLRHGLASSGADSRASVQGGAPAPALRQDRYFLASVCDPANAWDTSDGGTPFDKNKAKLASGDPYSTRRTYNALGQVLIQSDAKGHQQLTSYDSAGRKYAASVTPKGGALTPVTKGINYTAAGAIATRSDANNIQVAYVYEPQTTQRLISVTATRVSTEIQALTYAYDGVGNVIALSDNSAGTQVSFFRNRAVTPDRGYINDALYQLTSGTGRENYVNNTPKGTDWPAGQFSPANTPDYQAYTRSYTYDLGGNLTAIRSSNWSGATPPTRQLVVGNSSNRAVCTANNPGATQANIDTYFDPAGKIVCLDANRNQPMYWTALHQLYCVVTTYRPPGSGAGKGDWSDSDREQYAYDGSGQRVRKYTSSQASSGSGANTWNTVDTRYLPGLELRTNTATGENLEVIVLDDGARMLNWAGGTGKPSDIPNLQLRYQYSDRQNSCQIETDSDGNVIAQEEYYPYGGTAVLASRGNSEVKYKYVRYSGKERDATGLYYYGLRYYQPWIGRWINPDPAGTVDGQNLYCMVGNNPVTMVDAIGAYGDDQPGNADLDQASLSDIPKTVHYVWMGKEISEDDLSNVLLASHKNPDYRFKIWTDRIEAISTPLLAMLENNESPLNQHLAGREGKFLVDPGSRISVEDISSVFDSLRVSMPSESNDAEGQPRPGVGAQVESLFHREKNGTYKNFAAASDIARMAILFEKGGIYLDVDVIPRKPLGTLSPSCGFMYMYWGQNNKCSNNVMASTKGSAPAKAALNKIVENYIKYDKDVAEEIATGIEFEDPIMPDIWKKADGAPSWIIKRAEIDINSIRGRKRGTMDLSGPEVTWWLANKFPPNGPEDYFSVYSFGSRYYIDDLEERNAFREKQGLPPSIEPRSKTEAVEKLIEISRAPLPDREKLLFRDWKSPPDTRAPWETTIKRLRRTDRSSI